ncbi:MAG: hypothetical protein ABII13_04805 [Patescibacteria group bacterium]
MKCSCGNEKEICIDCMQDFITNSEKLHAEVKRLCDFICNSKPSTKINGDIESMALILAHHPLILNR